MFIVLINAVLIRSSAMCLTEGGQKSGHMASFLYRDNPRRAICYTAPGSASTQLLIVCLRTWPNSAKISHISLGHLNRLETVVLESLKVVYIFHLVRSCMLGDDGLLKNRIRKPFVVMIHYKEVMKNGRKFTLKLFLAL